MDDFHCLSPECCQVEFHHRSDCVPESDYVNTFVASFTTAYGRIKLYRQLARLGRRAVYIDTDSIIYTCNGSPGELHPPYGEHLGQWTRELKAGDTMVEFVSSGPKSYAYRTRCGETVVKVKGITINYEIDQIVNFDSIKALVLHYAAPEEFPLPDSLSSELIAKYPDKIHRDRYKFELYGRDVKKKFRVTYSKRQLLRDGSFDTVPYGF